jgi:hypothetical protein
MEDIGSAFRIMILTSILGFITCTLMGIVILILRRLTSGRKERGGQT